jgi:hypothetical protein
VGVQRVDDGASPVAYGGKGVVDVVGKTPARWHAWSAGSSASSGEGEGRPEAEVASGVTGVGVWLDIWR